MNAVKVSTYHTIGIAYPISAGTSAIPTSAIPSDYFVSGATSGTSTSQPHLWFLSGTSYQDTIIQAIEADFSWEKLTIPISASFTFDTEIYYGDPVQFTDASIGNISAWSWTFGDGATSILQNPQYIYGDVGSYVVTLTVTDIYRQTSISSHTLIVQAGGGGGSM